MLHLQRPRLPHKSFGGFKIDIAPLTQVAVTLGTMQRTAGGQFDVHHPRPCKSGKLAAGNAALPQIGFQFAGNACRRDCQLKMTDVIKNQGDRIRRRCQPITDLGPFLGQTQLLQPGKGEKFINSRIATVAQAKIDADFFRDPCRRHIKIENEPADERVQQLQLGRKPRQIARPVQFHQVGQQLFTGHVAGKQPHRCRLPPQHHPQLKQLAVASRQCIDAEIQPRP